VRRIRECHHDLLESAITQRVIGAFYDVYNKLGYGYLESVYQRAMAIEIARKRLEVRMQVPVEVTYDGVIVGAFRADLLVEGRVVVELKSGKAMAPEHEMQLLNYLKATGIEVGLLLHFGPQAKFKRLVWTNPSRSRSDPPKPARSVGSASSRDRRHRHHEPGQPLTAAPPPAPGPSPVPPPAAYPTP